MTTAYEDDDPSGAPLSGGRRAAAGREPAVPRPAAGPRPADIPGSGDGPEPADVPGGNDGPRPAGAPGNGDEPTQDPSRGDDRVMAVVRQWRAVHPGLATAPMELIGRLNRCAALLQQAEDAPLRLAGLSRAEFDLLGALRRTGRPLTPGDLARETFSSGAAVTKRTRQLAGRGLVERHGDSRDRRVIRIHLTDAGRDLVDGVLPGQLAYEAAALSGLAPAEQADLTALLSALLIQLEGRLGGFR